MVVLLYGFWSLYSGLWSVIFISDHFLLQLYCKIKYIAIIHTSLGKIFVFGKVNWNFKILEVVWLCMYSTGNENLFLTFLFSWLLENTNLYRNINFELYYCLVTCLTHFSSIKITYNWGNLFIMAIFVQVYIYLG